MCESVLVQQCLNIAIGVAFQFVALATKTIHSLGFSTCVTDELFGISVSVDICVCPVGLGRHSIHQQTSLSASTATGIGVVSLSGLQPPLSPHSTPQPAPLGRVSMQW
jgi:hypothetical protein